jgi:two-component system, chemotaxis family, sensor kinase CheA
MDKRNEEFRKQLLNTFKLEAAEHLQAMTAGLLELEKAPSAEKQQELVETIFREVHSLKGAARVVNLAEIERICQSLESIFATLKRDRATTSAALFDVLHEAVDLLGKLLVSIGTEPTAEVLSSFRGIIRRLEATMTVDHTPAAGPRPGYEHGIAAPQAESDQPFLSNEQPVATAQAESDQPPLEKPATVETVRISTAKLSSLLLQAEELITVKLVTGQHATELREVVASLTTWQEQSARVHPDLLAVQRLLESHSALNGHGYEALTKLREFLESTGSYVKEFEDRLDSLTKAVEQAHRAFGRMVDDLLEEMKQALLFPFSSLLAMLPKLVRDLSRARGKQVELIIQGRDVEIDRQILEEMKDPLIHILRNCIDHGIEKPDERERKSKPALASVTVAIAQSNRREVELLISDDGAGIDIGKVKAAAVKSSVLSFEEAQALPDRAALSLIFHSGISTSPMLTDISGRGLGLAIVQEKVEKLGGTVAVESQLDIGTTFRITLPVTRSIFRGVVIRVGDDLFVVPTINIERVVRVQQEAIKTVENTATIELNGQVVPLIRLGDVLNLSRSESAKASLDKAPVVVLVAGQKRIAFRVDDVLNEQEVLVKSLGPQLARVRNIDAATVLGTGRVAPILNVPDLIKSAGLTSAAGYVGLAAPLEHEDGTRKSILVAEDSIITRTLLRNVLEAAGFDVRVAIDGLDALTQLRAQEFDLVVSDVEMPRMNGFELIAKIRSDKKLAELPVVLVTALQSREDRERGIEVGANAYIAKGSFDQSNLLETIRRLI